MRVLVIFGLLRGFTVLGIKLDECPQCGAFCEHVVGRKTNWGHIFWVPFLFLGLTHGMACSACRHWTGIPWRTVRAAMRTGTLPLDRPRPTAQAMLAAQAAEAGEPPPHPAAVFDRFDVNPKRGGWDLYLKAWPMIVAALIAIGALAPRTAPSQAASHSAPHQCWEAADGSITGCRMADGTVEGETTGTPTTCFFDEPLPSADVTLRCTRD
jgi:hypothetical protein